MGLLILGAFIVMVGVIWFNEGWQKGLKLIGLFIGSVFLVYLEHFLNVQNYHLPKTHILNLFCKAY